MKSEIILVFVSSIYCLNIKRFTKLHEYVDCDEQSNNIDSFPVSNSILPTNSQHKKQEKQHKKQEKQYQEHQKQEKQYQKQEKQPSQEHKKEEHQPSTKNTNVGGNSSKATFYFRVGDDVPGCPTVQTFNDGMSYGPCKSEDGSPGVKYTSNSKYWAAIANASSRCGDTITVSYNGNSIQLKVMDECPACREDNHVDMGLDALIELTGSKEAACSINRPMPIITWS
jgi:type II secretory pathway pseudopilin PulG